MRIPRAVAIAIFATLGVDAGVAATMTVVDVPSGTHTQRILDIRPAAPVANIVALPGGSGILLIQNDGTMDGSIAACFPIARLRQGLADHGFAVALVGENSDTAVGQFADIQEVVGYMRGRAAVPTWLIGGSSSTATVVNAAVKLPSDSPVGLIMYSPGKSGASQAASVRRPVEIVYHPLDPYQDAILVYDALTSAPVKSLVALSGGSDDNCGFHLFNGLDAELLAAISGFIDQNNGNLASSNLLVVEYHHAAFDHYFITPVAAEIALLDAKAPPFQDWSRTGFTFNAYSPSSGPAGSVAICRFFNSSFAPKSSHFYAPKGLGCEATLAKFPDWKLEDDKLVNVMLPDAGGSCPAGTIPVYRLYNGGMGGAPNHRFVTSLTERQKMIDKGFVAEGNGIGVGMCVPGL